MFNFQSYTGSRFGYSSLMIRKTIQMAFASPSLKKKKIIYVRGEKIASRFSCSTGKTTEIYRTL